MARFEDEFLNAPIQKFGDVKLVWEGASDFVNPAELAGLLAGFAEDAENFSIEGEFIDASGETVGVIEDLIWPGRNANGPGRTGSHGACGGGGLIANGGAGIGIYGNIDGELAEKVS